VSETVGIWVFLGFLKKPSLVLIQSKTSGNPYVAGVLFDAQPGDCSRDHKLLDLRSALEDGMKLSEQEAGQLCRGHDEYRDTPPRAQSQLHHRSAPR